MNALALLLLGMVGTEAPAFSSIEWVTPPPQTEGRVVLVRFWLGGCPYCVASAPVLNRIHQDFGARGVTVVGIHHPKSEEAKSLNYVREHQKKLGLTFAVGQDADWSTAKAFGVGSYFKRFTSVSVLYDQAGVIRWAHDGGTLDDAADGELRKVIQSLLARPTREVKLSVKGWVCQACADKTLKALRKDGGVLKVDTRLADNQVVVTFDPEVTSIAKLISAITALGYQAR